MKKESRFSESFIMGIIALVFLVIGYQTALFIHNAAVTKIAANRDEPDTVYVYESISAENGMPAKYSAASGSVSGTSSTGGRPPAVSEHRNASHSARAESVRSKLPRRRTESFPFDPNTASVDELCRLGFSQKQAQSIDNYRKKGGRFRRKEDFAKSFVVSDSIYRRLEGYIDIPKTDLNLADSAAFDALPGIGGWFASRIIEHRQALRGYSYKEQLMDIYRFDADKFRALEDLVEIRPENLHPYPLWSLPADSLRLHPYIQNYETARAIVLFRTTTPPSDWTVDNLLQAGILSASSARKLSLCSLAPPPAF